MTPDELAAFFHEHVVPTYREFVKQLDSDSAGNSQDLRSGLLAALAAYHFREHLEGALALTTAEVSAQCQDYSLLRDVADIAKHRNLNRPSAVLQSPDAMQEVIVITVYEDGFGEYRDSEKLVELRLSDGTSRRFDEVLTNVMMFWARHLRAHNIPLLEATFNHRVRNEPLSREECAEAGRNLKMVRGLRFKQEYRLQKYNYEKGLVESVDLSRAKVRFRIYKPKYEIDLVLTNEKSGEEIRRTIALTPEQAEEFDKLETNEARQAFLHEVSQIREAFGKLVAEARKINMANISGEDEA